MKAPKTMIPDMVKKILRKLERTGFEAYVVGGAVRDMVMGKAPTDWDVATSASGEEVENLFPHLTRFSLRHGTITLVGEGKHYEVSTFRGPSPTIEDDLAYRDFTINAMAYHSDERKILDPFGGCKDIARRMVRAVGAPEDRFQEDPLRILRAVRISCELDFRIHPETRKAMSAMASLLSAVAEERIRDELLKILISEKPSRGFQGMVRTKLLKEILPELQNIPGPTLKTMDRVPPDPVLRLAALFHDAGAAKKGQGFQDAGIVEEVLRRMKFSERMVTQVAHLLRHHRQAMGYDASWTEGAVRRLVRAVRPEQVNLLFSLCRADLESQGKETRVLSDLEKRVQANLETGFPCRVQDLKVDGRKVMEVLNIPEGPEVGRILEALLEEVLDHPEWNTKEKLTELSEEMSKDRAMDR
jgi:tRNA nucleotidyltransferase/poly(A) polymerase